MKVKKEVAMLNWLHPKNTIDVSISAFVVEGIDVWFVVIIEVVSISLAIVEEIIVDTTSDIVWFLVREVVSITLGIVVEIIVDIIVDITSDKVWVIFTIVVGSLFDFSSSSAHLIFPSLSALPSQI